MADHLILYIDADSVALASSKESGRNMLPLRRKRTATQTKQKTTMTTVTAVLSDPQPRRLPTKSAKSPMTRKKMEQMTQKHLPHPPPNPRRSARQVLLQVKPHRRLRLNHRPMAAAPRRDPLLLLRLMAKTRLSHPQTRKPRLVQSPKRPLQQLPKRRPRRKPLRRPLRPVQTPTTTSKRAPRRRQREAKKPPLVQARRLLVNLQPKRPPPVVLVLAVLLVVKVPLSHPLYELHNYPDSKHSRDLHLILRRHLTWACLHLHQTCPMQPTTPTLVHCL